ncbi:aminotransferase class IV [Saccharopolyspora gregorii]|uniref:aminotransferase class IV n=1 Tax=Saccharopolyspora gregorii TaxID=33914 RepID=UPI003CD09DFE
MIDAWPWDAEREMALKLVCSRGVDGGDGTPTGFATGSSVGADTPRCASARTASRRSPSTAGSRPTSRNGRRGCCCRRRRCRTRRTWRAARKRNAAAADEVIFTATDGSVLEGPTSAVVIARGRTLRHPAAEHRDPAGTTQGALFRAAEKAVWETRVDRSTRRSCAPRTACG